MPGFPRSLRLFIAGLLALIACATALGDTQSRDREARVQIRALAPVEIVASGFQELSAAAVEPSGAILVTDRARGTLTRIDPSGKPTVLRDDLHGPSGVAVDRAGHIFLVEAAARRVLLIDGDQITAVMASDLRQPQSISVGPDDRIWIAMRQTPQRGAEYDRGADPDAEYVIARMEESGMTPAIASGLMGVQGLAADAAAVYVTIARLASERGHQRTTVGRVSIGADGTATPAEPVPVTTWQRTFGLGIDAAGALFVTGTAADEDAAGLIVKRHGGGEISVFAEGLKSPVAIAFGPGGHLVAVENRPPGRVLRFRAPSAPMLSAPAFTNQTPFAIEGRSGAGDRVDVFRGVDRTQSIGTAVADAASGAFAVRVPLEPNSHTDLSVVATAAGGAGLVSPPADLRIVHDDRRPSVTIGYPLAGAYVRDTITLRARAEDQGSGIASITFMLEADEIATVEGGDPAAPLTAIAALDVRGVQEGPHTLTVAATDRAGNTAAAAQLLTVDRTPPETYLVSGPGTDTADRTVTFVAGASDEQSPAFEFSWRMDDGAWAPYGPAAAIALPDVTPGTHRFEVRARDLAGNEDATPAVYLFTVAALQLRISEPAAGAVITTETVWVRGTVSAAGPVAITTPLPEEFRRELSVESLAVPAIAGTFAVLIPVTAGTTVITIGARDGQGATATESVEVAVQPPFSETTGGLDAFPAAGVAPHLVRFAVASRPTGSYRLDLDSDGTAEYVGDDLDEREFIYAKPGMYVARLAVTTPAGEMLTWRTSVQVYDRAALEGQLRTAWAGFKEALRSGDIERVATFVHSGRRPAWQDYLKQLPASAFAGIDSVFTDVMLLEVAPGRAECEMMREVEGLLYSFPVSFRIDADGRWRLWQF